MRARLEERRHVHAAKRGDERQRRAGRLIPLSRRWRRRIGALNRATSDGQIDPFSVRCWARFRSRCGCSRVRPWAVCFRAMVARGTDARVIVPVHSAARGGSLPARASSRWLRSVSGGPAMRGRTRRPRVRPRPRRVSRTPGRRSTKAPTPAGGTLGVKTRTSSRSTAPRRNLGDRAASNSAECARTARATDVPATHRQLPCRN